MPVTLSHKEKIVKQHEKDKYMMTKNTYDPDDFFNDINFASAIDNVKGVFTSDGAMANLLDFERALDEADLYAFKNWELGELVQGPVVKKYTIMCVFLYPYKMMPDPRGAKRLISIGAQIKFKHTKIKVPVKIESEDDFMEGNKYPKSKEKDIWLISIRLPKEMLDDVREGSIELADQTIDLEELDDSYDEDLDTAGGEEEDGDENAAPQDIGMQGPGAGPELPQM